MQVETARLDPMIEALASEYEKSGSWRKIQANHEIWSGLLHKYIFLTDEITGSGPKPGQNNFPGFLGMRPHRFDRPPGDFRENHPGSGSPDNLFHPPPRPKNTKQDDDPLSFDPRLFLADKQHRLIIGSQHEKDEMLWKPIELKKQIIGYLGYRPSYSESKCIV